MDVEAEHYCEGILTAIPAELPCGRASRFGATAWRVSMARRQVVESANSALKGACADLSRGFFRVMGLVRTTVLLSFTLAAYNLDRIRSFKAKHGLDDNGQVCETIDPLGNVTRYTHDASGELIQVQGPLGALVLLGDAAHDGAPRLRIHRFAKR